MAEHKFCFIPHEIVEGLHTYGNWKVRQSAIESLSTTIENVLFDHDVKAELPAFINFLFVLVDDPNFKIKQGALDTVNTLIKKLAKETDAYLRLFVEKLSEKLLDPKTYVKAGCYAACQNISQNIGPIKFALALKNCAKSHNLALKEEIVLVYIMILLHYSSTQSELDHLLVTLTFDFFKEAVLEQFGNIAGYAVEGLLFLKSKLQPNEFYALLHKGNQLPTAILVKLNKAFNARSASISLSHDGLVDVKDILRFYDVEPLANTDCVAEGKEIGSELQKRCSLVQSHPVTLDDQCSSQEEISMFQREISTAVQLPQSTSSEMSPCDTRNVTSEMKQDIFVDPSPNDAMNSDLDSSSNIAARIDRIARLLRRKDENVLPENSAQTSKSATMSLRRRENLNLLKIKQKDRRTHSANAVLQHKLATAKEESFVHSLPNQETLPSIHANKDSFVQKKETPSLFGDCSEKSSLIKARRFESKRSSRNRKEGKSQLIEQSTLNKVPLSSISLFSEDDGGYESPGAVSIPNSLSSTRPGTFTSGISTSLRTTVGDVSITEPFIDPEAVAASVIERLRVANNTRKKEIDWLSQAEALNDARRLVYHHPHIVRKILRDFVLAFVPALQQLRSTTSRTAITLCQELFENLGEAIDHDLEEIVPLLLKKAGETSNAGRDTFLASEADNALSVMVQNVGTTRALHVLLQHANNSSKYIRSKVAAHLDDCLALAAVKLKASSNLTLIDRVFTVGVSFLEEGYQQTRTYGKRILWQLKHWIDNRGAFERLVCQLEPESKKRRVWEITQYADGPPSVPLRGMKSQLRRRHRGSSLTPSTPSLVPPSAVSQLDGSSSCYSLTTRLMNPDLEEIDSPHQQSFHSAKDQASNGSQICKIQRPPKPFNQKLQTINSDGRRQSFNSSENLTNALGKVNAKDWKQRIEGLRQLEQMSEKLHSYKEKDFMNIIDQLTYRLNDGNSKVVVTTLETLKSVFGRLGRKDFPCLNTVLPALVSNLASSIEKIRSASGEVVDKLIESTDSSVLIQSFSQCCGNGNPRAKAFLLQKLHQLSTEVYETKPQLIAKYVLPVAFNSLADIRVDVREVNSELLRSLSQLVGHSFIEKAESLTGANRQRLFDILRCSF